ncbi:CRISPR-associated helicase Cas3' [Streptomyces sp. NPDC008001]|uniref:CRISPR-associated helicase Cas3' n=1 Tax=Streptomyces sp. NPDC008001 TaxID=3364804 RepID=UPI0036E04361
MGLESVDQRLWGKAAGLGGQARYPLICHLLDTGAVAGALWDGVLTAQARERLAGLVGVPVEVCRRLLCTWAGLHHLGKITPCFQGLVSGARQELAGEAAYRGGFDASEGKLRHDAAAQWVLPEVLDLWGYPSGRRVTSSAQHQVAQLLAGHHGCFYRPLEPRHARDPLGWAPGLGGDGWGRQRLAHAAAVRRLVGEEGDVLPGPVPGAAAVPLLGLIVVADWLASQEHVVKAALPREGWRADESGLSGHWRSAVAGAGRVVAEAGLGVCSFRDARFSEQFPFPANALQASLIEGLPRLLTGGPGLLVVTAPTGDGKTEAGLHAASLLARASGASGVYFALPTMATADAMYVRVREFVEGNAEGERSLTLLHSMAWLSEEYATSAGAGSARGSRVLSETGSSTAAGHWLRSAKRGLLAPLSVGTIDQALTGVLPVRYNVLRLLGLSNKVLVVDEAHAYGPWMQSLLVRLLEWLGAMGAPVVLLSATLAGRTASALVEAYRRGCGYPDPSSVEPAYPGWLFVSAASGEVSSPRQVSSDRSRRLRLELVAAAWEGAGAGGLGAGVQGRGEALAEAVAPAVAGGGCVLVCCTTVAEAQQTYRFLQGRVPELAARDGGLLLLHARYPAAQRAEIARVCERAFGKPGGEESGGSGRPVCSVLVATQVVEQSLDLDFDLVVSDLAPLAQLLQRAGRCMRHDRTGLAVGAGGRPGWVGEAPRLVVLESVGGDGRVEVPVSWGSVYDGSLLVRTSELLHEYAHEGVAVPGDVQVLVDRVYAEGFAEGLEDAAERERLRMLDAERQGAVMAEEVLAQLAAIASPEGLFDLSRLSNEGGRLVDEALVTTRLGADSARVVCAFVQPDGSESLDAGGRVAWPGADRSLSREEVRAVMLQSAPVPGRWLAGRSEVQDVPSAWGEWPVLAGLVVLRMRRGAGAVGESLWSCRVGDQVISFSDLGFAIS